MNIKALGHKALVKAKHEGASQAEAYAVRSTTRSVYVDDSRIKMVEHKSDQGLSVRVLKGRRLAMASSVCSSVEEAEGCAKAASLLADRSPSSASYDNLPFPAPPLLTGEPEDRQALDLEQVELVELVKATVGVAADRGVSVPRGVMRVSAISSAVINTNGVDAEHRATMVVASYEAMADGPTPGEGISTFNSPWLKGYEPATVGEEMARRALAARTAKPFEGSLKAPLIISSEELGEMFSTSVLMALSAESVNKRRSPWTDMIDRRVASDKLTMVDDPSDLRGALSGMYDDEGVPASVKTVVDEGVLKTFFYDSYNSSVFRRTPSGNGVRRNPFDGQYLFQSNLGCAPLNLVVRPGQRTPEEMIGSLDEGVMVEKFASPTVNPFTGAFGLEARLAHVIKNGAVEGQIKHALVVGNMYEGLRNILEVGRDSRTVGNMILPTMAFQGFEVVGSK